MNNQIPDEINLLEISNGLRIGLAESGTWQIWAKNGCFDLREIADYWRVVILLERPYSEIELTFNKYAEKINTKNSFPLWKIVGAGLAFGLDEWANLALAWFPHLTQDEKVMISDLLENVASSKWASQKSRQLANRYIKQMRTL